MRCTLALLCLVARTALAAQPDAGPPAPEELGAFTLAATGDILMHEAVKAVAADAGFAALFGQAAPVLQSVDVGFGNLETPVAPKAGKGSRAFVFNAPRELLPALKTAGFKVVLAANNHAYDQGVAGVSETVMNLEDAGLSHVGTGRTHAEAEAPVILEQHGVKVGFLGFTARFNQNFNEENPKQPHVAPADADAMIAAVAALAKTVDAVVVAIHWGQEYQAEPDAEQLELAKRLVDAGALVILGSHPHVLQRLEVLPAVDGRNALVAYSLGNFVSNQSREYAPGVVPDAAGDTRDGALLKLKLRKRRYVGGSTQTEIGETEVVPLWTDNNALLSKRQPRPAIDIHVTDLLKELRADKAELMPLARSTAALSEDQRRRANELQKRIELLSLRLARIQERLGGDFVPRE